MALNMGLILPFYGFMVVVVAGSAGFVHAHPFGVDVGKGALAKGGALAEGDLFPQAGALYCAGAVDFFDFGQQVAGFGIITA